MTGGFHRRLHESCVVDPANCLECADESASDRGRTPFEHKPRKFVDVRSAEGDRVASW